MQWPHRVRGQLVRGQSQDEKSWGLGGRSCHPTSDYRVGLGDGVDAATARAGLSVAADADSVCNVGRPWPEVPLVSGIP